MLLIRRVWRLFWPLVLLAADGLCALGALAAAHAIRRTLLPRFWPHGLKEFAPWPAGFVLPPYMALFLAVLLAALAFEGLYHRLRAASDEWRHLWRAIFFTTVIFLALVSLGAAAERISRTMVALTGGLLLLLLPVERYLLRRLAARLGLLRERALLLATPAGEAAVRRLIDHGHLPGLELSATLHPDELAAGDWLSVRIEARIHEAGAQIVFISAEGIDPGTVERLAVAASALVPLTRVLPGESSAPLAGMETEYFLSGEAVGLSLRAARLTRPGWRALKSALDYALGLLIALIFLPALALLALIVRLDSAGPVFFRQRRIGRGGEEFAVYKFRTMVPDAEKKLSKLLQKNPDLANQWEGKFKLADDPRVTRAGRWLRKTSLDELPQLINVLYGDMSLVGPRPIVAAEIPRYGEAFADYARLRPGLTGLWQVSGRSDTSYARRVFLDQWYLRYWTPWLDLAILVRTAFVVLRREGAR